MSQLIMQTVMHESYIKEEIGEKYQHVCMHKDITSMCFI